MLHFNLLRLSGEMAGHEDLAARVSKLFSARIAGTLVLSSLPSELIRRMKSLEQDARVLVANERFLMAPHHYRIDRRRFCPLCALWRNGGDLTYLPVSEALVEGNYLLCISGSVGNEKAKTDPAFFEEMSEYQYARRRLYTDEFRAHVDISTFRRRRTKYPAYVNLDRDHDSIGFSSWDGNLVSWLESGFTTRIQFGVHSGLFPQEDEPHG